MSDRREQAFAALDDLVTQATPYAEVGHVGGTNALACLTALRSVLEAEDEPGVLERLQEVVIAALVGEPDG